MSLLAIFMLILTIIVLILTVIVGVITMVGVITKDASSSSEAILDIVVAGCWFLFVIFLLWCIVFSDALITQHPVEILPATIITSTV